MVLLRQFNHLCSTGLAVSGYTSGLCGEWTQERFQLFAKQFDIRTSDLVVANQKHTDQVMIVDALDAGIGVIRPYEGEPFDAMISAEPGLMLCVHTADCVPVVFLDPVKKTAGIAHSGWVGTSRRIAGKTVRKMAEVFGSRPEDILCAMGPYNHACCYEVGPDVRESFREAFSETECEKLFKKKNTEEKYLLDLGAAISLSLQQEGVGSRNISDCGCCTYHTTEFSSWRRTRNRKHQILSYIMLKETVFT